MDSRCDFEITADGELIRYSGPGGAVAIPEGVRFVAREGVFDPSVKITKLHLPSTLLGHRHDEGCKITYIYRVNPDKCSRKIDRYVPSLVDCAYPTLKEEDFLFDPLTLELPELESYEVAQGSELYSSSDGVLLCVDRPEGLKVFVLDIPKKSTLPVGLKCSFNEYSRRNHYRLSMLGPALIVHMDDVHSVAELKDRLEHIGPCNNEHIIQEIHAPNLVITDEDQSEDLEFLNRTIILIAPKCTFELNDPRLNHSLALGYLTARHLFSEDKVIPYMRHIVMYENELKDKASLLDATEAARFLRERMLNGHMCKHFADEDIESPIPLLEYVLLGTVDELNSMLERCYCCMFGTNEERIASIQEWCEVLKVACRYVSEDKMKCIVQSKLFNTSWNSEALEQAYDRGLGHIAMFIHHKAFPGSIDWFKLGASGEFGDLTPLPMEQRLERLAQLMSHAYGEDLAKQWECLLAHVYDCTELADKLDKDVDMASFAQRAQVGRDLEELIDLSKYFQLYDSQYVLKLLHTLKSLGLEPLPLRSCMPNSDYDDKDFFRQVFPYIKVQEHDVKALIIFKCLSNNYNKNFDLITDLIDSGCKISNEAFKKFAEMLQRYEQPELVAMILDEQNRRKAQGNLHNDSSTSLTL